MCVIVALCYTCQRSSIRRKWQEYRKRGAFLCSNLITPRLSIRWHEQLLKILILHYIWIHTDWFFAPQLHEWMGPIQETSAPRAIKYFTEFTSTFLNEEHELHDQYAQTMTRLLQLPDFRYMLDVSRKLPIRLYIPDYTEARLYRSAFLHL